MSVKHAQDAIKQRILARAEAGASNQRIAAELLADGITGWSVGPVQRLVREHMGPRRVSKKTPVEPVEGSEVEDAGGPPPGVLPLTSTTAIPDDAPLAAYDWWADEARRAYLSAKAVGNTAAASTWARVSAQILEAKRKATPDKAPDPNEAPDYIRLAEAVEAKLLELVDKVLSGEV